MAFHDSPKAMFFSATMRSNSLRSRGEGLALERAMRVTRWATTCGTARASSAAWVASERETRLRRVAISALASESTTVGLCRLTLQKATGGGPVVAEESCDCRMRRAASRNHAPGRFEVGE